MLGKDKLAAPVTLRLSDPMRARLDRLAKREGVSPGTLAREAPPVSPARPGYLGPPWIQGPRD